MEKTLGQIQGDNFPEKTRQWENLIKNKIGIQPY
jgi:hypothetical protein